jgi:hypothetical protein
VGTSSFEPLPFPIVRRGSTGVKASLGSAVPKREAPFLTFHRASSWVQASSRAMKHIMTHINGTLDKAHVSTVLNWPPDGLAVLVRHKGNACVVPTHCYPYCQGEAFLARICLTIGPESQNPCSIGTACKQLPVPPRRPCRLPQPHVMPIQGQSRPCGKEQ